MSDTAPADWDPRSPKVLDNQIQAYDEMRHRCPVAYSDYLLWSLFRHEDVMRALTDHETFSNGASRHLSIPNAMDPPEHTPYRRIVEKYFTQEHIDEFEPVCRANTEALFDDLPPEGDIEVMSALAQPFAVRNQCAFMGWPDSLREPLRQWIGKNHRATRAGDRQAMSKIALEFDGYISEQLILRREAGEEAPPDATTRLLHEKVEGRWLSDEEIVSIIRNWTVGELGTIAASVGILIHYLAAHPELQEALRQGHENLPEAIDEILRIHAPLISNRRITTRAVTIGGREIPAGERLSVIWASANRDEDVFGDPDEFQPQRNRDNNLLYGAGLHVCPGAPLARLELQVFMETLLAKVRHIELSPDTTPERAQFPASGFASLPVRVQRG
ncbi:cytochrome P450 [Pistricoccus aurantiacus]|uniref:Cytochrome P450 n=1 Tax=Pistricoccus aurantiacus TaxID=1883414 RepID=A0A5B8SQH3_9GAMM|nr:cytochrome P450 [Pistricoccus aurantiacus]QEA38217.1 cytochrome P450 [Pistricoccus aurantiacus]